MPGENAILVILFWFSKTEDISCSACWKDKSSVVSQMNVLLTVEAEPWADSPTFVFPPKLHQVTKGASENLITTHWLVEKWSPGADSQSAVYGW